MHDSKSTTSPNFKAGAEVRVKSVQRIWKTCFIIHCRQTVLLACLEGVGGGSHSLQAVQQTVVAMADGNAGMVF